MYLYTYIQSLEFLIAGQAQIVSPIEHKVRAYQRSIICAAGLWVQAKSLTLWAMFDTVALYPVCVCSIVNNVKGRVAVHR